MKPLTPSPTTAHQPRIESRIQLLRGQRVLIDSDLAALYGVDTRRLNEQVKRNADRFPADFVIQLTQEEFIDLKSQIATSSSASSGHGGRRKLPLAFTEHGAIMAATVLNSQQAIEMGIYVVRAFVQLRQLTASHQDLAKRLSELELKAEGLELKQQGINHNTRNQLKHIIETLRELTNSTAAPAPEPEVKKRPIGFVYSASQK
jgi:ORF6N domain